MRKENIQCTKILEGIEELTKYLKNDIAKNALEIDQNALTAHNSKLLERLRASLLQYRERGKDLIYIGFMGHFSTGKSSTINSLLNFSRNSKNYRNVGLNPVDKSITLITHSKNVDSLLNVTSGGLLKIATKDIEHDFLENIVIADTPGTGDPILLEDIAKDFLPICDLIIYFFSATNPLDSADKSLLEEKFSDLYFIPTSFVITRSDEFKKDRNKRLDENNFDIAKSSQFIGEFIQRVNHLFHEKRIDISEDDVFLIDNKDDFRLEDLRAYISDFANPKNSSAQIEIHSHKILYFQNCSRKLKLFFEHFIHEKSELLSQFVTNATENIKRFESTIQIRNNNLTKLWSDSHEKVINEADNIYKFTSENISLSESICSHLENEQHDDLVFYNTLEKNVVNFLNKRSKENKQIIISRVNDDVNRLRKELNEATIFNLVNNRNKYNLEISKKIFEDNGLPNKDQSLPNFFADDSKKMIDNWIKDIKHDCTLIQGNTVELAKRLAEKQPLSSYKEILERTEEELSRDFENLFDLITVYRSGVFSFNVKQAISDLGLGNKLDQLESNDLSETSKDEIKKKATDIIFPNMGIALTNFSRRIAELDSHCKKYAIEIEKLTSNLNSKKTNFFSNEDLKIESSIISDLNRRDIEEFDSIELDINTKILENISHAIHKWETENDSIRTERIKYYSSVFFVTFLLGVTIAVLYYFFHRNGMPSGLIPTVIVGISVNLITGFLVSLYTFWKERFPKKRRLLETKILEDFRFSSTKLIQDKMDYYLDGNNKTELFDDKKIDEIDSRVNFEGLDNSIIHSAKKKIYEEPFILWKSEYLPLLQELDSIYEKYTTLVNDYYSTVNVIKEKISTYFLDSDDNLKKLEELSAELRQRAVDPSFELLSSTNEELKKVESRIHNIHFS